MKKMLLAAFLLFLSTQTLRAQLTWDLRIGANVSGFTEGDTQMKIGVKGGLGIEYGFTRLFALRPGLYISTKGATVAGNSLGFNPHRTFNLTYLELPVLASFRFYPGPCVTLALNGGPYAACRISRDPAQYDPKRADFGIMAGLDCIVSHVVVGVEAQYGLVSLERSGGSLRSMNYSLTLGYRF
ncbi:MAG: PorT family protein [Rikenellaceae bacterium]|nr:PorT family protein [Rikenellaceae bacterium]